MKFLQNYNLYKIKIPKQFFYTLPSEKKIQSKIDVIQNKPEFVNIVIDYRNKLVDGFATYLAAGSLKIDRLDVTQLNFFETININNINKTTFVYGKHFKDDKERIWRVTKEKEEKLGTIHKGEKLIVMTKKGPTPITVTKVVKKLYPPINKKIKTVVGRPNY